MTIGFTILVGSVNFVDQSSAQLIEPNNAVLSPEIDLDWRYTKNGWQHIGELRHDKFAPLRTFESIHPFIWAATVMLAVVATTVWASSEWEIARLWKEE